MATTDQLSELEKFFGARPKVTRSFTPDGMYYAIPKVMSEVLGITKIQADELIHHELFTDQWGPAFLRANDPEYIWAKVDTFVTNKLETLKMANTKTSKPTEAELKAQWITLLELLNTDRDEMLMIINANIDTKINSLTAYTDFDQAGKWLAHYRATPKADEPEVDEHISEPSHDDETGPTEPDPVPAGAPKLRPSELLSSLRTLTGIAAGEIPDYLNRPYHKQAYREGTKLASGGKATYVAPQYIRQRLNKVFGPQGLGWHMRAAEGCASIYGMEGTTKENPHVVVMFGFVLEYALVDDSLNIQYFHGSVVSAASDNMKRNYAARGATSTLTNAAVTLMGGMDHLGDTD